MRAYSKYELPFLRAAANLVDFQRRLLAKFEAANGMSAYDYWVRRRVGRTRTGQRLLPAPWRFHFHGLEVEALHEDGRHVRIELGPRGMTNVITGWSVAVHVVGTREPWPSYPQLRQFLAQGAKGPEHSRVSALEDALLAAGYITRADSELYELRVASTRRVSPTESRIDIPRDLLPEVSEDVVLCERFVLTELGQHAAAGVEARSL